MTSDLCYQTEIPPTQWNTNAVHVSHGLHRAYSLQPNQSRHSLWIAFSVLSPCRKRSIRLFTIHLAIRRMRSNKSFLSTKTSAAFSKIVELSETRSNAGGCVRKVLKISINHEEQSSSQNSRSIAGILNFDLQPMLASPVFCSIHRASLTITGAFLSQKL